MAGATQPLTMLNGCRALDLTDEKGFLCGKVLADLGVDVIKVEPPGGDPSRRIGPFWRDVPDGEKSLYWFAYNANKRGITLDIETSDGKLIFKDLVKTSDFVIESFEPGYMERIGLDYATLSTTNKGIIMTSITPFGQTGPYRDYKASDIVLMGMSGELFLTGDSDRPPVNIGLPQACLHAGADGAVGSMIAYHHRKRSGEGQHVDVSMQQSLAWFLATTVPYWELDRIILGRVGTFRSGSSSGTVQRQVWPCKDGFVFFFMIGGMQGAKTCRQLVKWMVDEGASDPFLMAFEWEQFDMASATQEPHRPHLEAHRRFLPLPDKERGIGCGYIEEHLDLSALQHERCAHRPGPGGQGILAEPGAPGVGTSIPYPKQFVRSSEAEITTRIRAPLIGEHNGEIYGEMGLSPREVVALKEAGVI